MWPGDPYSFPNVEPFLKAVRKSAPAADLAPLTHGGPAHWTETVTSEVSVLGKEDGPYVVENINAPMKNPYRSWMRLGGFDFFKDSSKAAVCTWMGDVWIVDGLGGELGQFSWRRIASGMFQPLGLKIVDETIYVSCRDQISRLHDLNGDGSKSEIVCNGFRAANGVGIGPHGELATSDQEGHWTPANRINLVKRGGFYGNMFSYHTGEVPKDYLPPLCWLPKGVDRSPAEALWVSSKQWGAELVDERENWRWKLWMGIFWRPRRR